MPKMPNIGNIVDDAVKKTTNSATVPIMMKKAYSKLGANGREFQSWYGAGAGTPWCAIFVCWVVYSGFGSKWQNYVPKTAVATIPRDIVNQKGGTWVKKPGAKECQGVPQPGDVWSRRSEYGGTSGYAHTGMVYSVDVKHKTITTIEGNYSNKVASNTKPWSYYYCIARPKWGEVGAFTNAESSIYLDEHGGIVLKKQVAKLYSSDNYKFLEQAKQEEESYTQKYATSLVQKAKEGLGSLFSYKDSVNTPSSKSDILSDSQTSKYTQEELQRISRGNTKLKLTASDTFVTKGNLLSYPALVEAPVIEITLDGITIGGRGNFGDSYPNYLQSLTVEKTGNKINKYQIQLVHQVRAGEDPNFIDKLLSRTGYINKIHILYGDSQSPSNMFRDDEAVITDVSFNESVGEHCISYSINAVSSIITASSSLSVYPSKTDKPSNMIRELLYSNDENSQLLLNALPGMRNKTLVESKGLIPTNDSIVTTQKITSASPLNMLNYYVQGMYNSQTNSTYYLSVHDDVKNEFGGAYLQINELSDNSANGNYFEVDVGYPGDNFVTNFSVNTDAYFPLVYSFNGKLSNWSYDIDNGGNIRKTRTNSLLTNNNFYRPNVVDGNWWNKVTEYPITASLTIKGLIQPVILGSYININVLFYGNNDLASGIYMVTGQRDSLSASGYRTTLELVRMGH